MNQRAYKIHQEGQAAAAQGAGLSDSPYGGQDGFLWRRSVSEWIDAHPDELTTENESGNLALERVGK
jgi:hypothetical protein